MRNAILTGDQRVAVTVTGGALSQNVDPQKLINDAMIPAMSEAGQRFECEESFVPELCTQYGPIEFFWMDHAQSDGGLDHASTVKGVHQFQPNTFAGFSHGEPAGRLSLRERGTPGPIGDPSTSRYNKKAEQSHKGYLAAEFTYPIQPWREKGGHWSYSRPENEDVCHPAEKLYKDYVGAVRHGNIFSIDVGPKPDGRLREIDVKTLQEVGRMILAGQAPGAAPMTRYITKGTRKCQNPLV